MLAIMGCILTIVTFFFLEETLYNPEIKEKSLSPPSLKERVIYAFSFNPVSEFYYKCVALLDV
jgi:hypothetical protein